MFVMRRFLAEQKKSQMDDSQVLGSPLNQHGREMREKRENSAAATTAEQKPHTAVE